MPASSTPKPRRPDPRYRIEIVDHTGAAPAAGPLRNAVTLVLDGYAVPRAGISIAIVADSVIRAVNARHLGHDWATDVITFPGDDSPEPPGTATGAAGRRAPASVSGEILISLDTARREASRRGIEPLAELALYAIHGTLHLLGLDDRTPRQRAAMRRAERRFLAAAGLAHPPARETGR